MKKVEVLYISQCNALYGSLAKRLIQINKQDQYILWADIYEKLCRGFSLKKQEIREALSLLHNFGFISISPRGVKLNFEVRE